MAATAVTPNGVRDAEPAALAALCAARGDAVLAYCEAVSGNADAPAAAADAFGRFRSAVVATTDLDGLNPEALLVNAARHAAAERAAGHVAGVCGEVPVLLAARADRSISLADLERLDGHLERCWACRAPVARFQAGERAYRDPPRNLVSAPVAAAIIAALEAAAPVRGQEPEPPRVAATPRVPAQTNGAGHFPATEHMPAVGPDTEMYIPGATAEFQPFDDEPPLETPTEPSRESRQPDGPPSRNGTLRGPSGVLAAMSAWLRARSDAERPHDSRSARAPRADVTPLPRPARRPRSARAPRADVTPLPRRERKPRAGAARLGTGAHLPRARSAGQAAPRPPHAAAGLNPATLIPFILVAIAVFIALLVAGVFAGGEPASKPQSSVPALEPQSSGTPPKVVVVPGAKQASAAAVERAKQRARAKRLRDAELTRQAAAAQEAQAAAPPPVAVTPPPPPPPPPPANKANRPATGAGTAPGATPADPSAVPDTSTVPELAPPDDTTLPPG